ncbi:MAG: hypothetical protein P1U65_10475 [Minwuia sp.]|nr:hypothetical protein [Minwuia sp.]
MNFDNTTPTHASSLSAFVDRRGETDQAVAAASEADEGFSFFDLLDVVNPLQHIPLVSTLYREISGDEIGNPARIAGGFLFGGVFGLAGSIANALVDEVTGKDVGDHVMEFVDSETSSAHVWTANSLQFERARNAYQQLDRSASEPMLDHVIEIP